MEILTALRKKSQKPTTCRRINTGTSSVVQLPIKSIKPNPNQPRKFFSSDDLKELSESIRVCGVIQPITVRRLGGDMYELVSGERRVRAAILAGLLRIPSIVVGMTDIDSALIALIENVQRCDLSYMEEAEAYHKLLNDFGYTQEQLAIKLGKNQSTIANKVRLLKLPTVIREILAENNLTERHARALLRLKSTERQIKALHHIVNKNLNVKQTDELVDKMLSGSSPIKKLTVFSQPTQDVRVFSNTIKKAVSVMRNNGIHSVSDEQEYDDRYEYHIKIYK